MNYGALKLYDIANGPGIRVSLFVSGCRHQCPDCFNQCAWDFDYGELYTEKTKQTILDALDNDYIEGFSLLGGEPFEPENMPECTDLLRNIKRRYPNKTIWCYSGFLYETLNKYAVSHRMLEYIDVLVDGKFIKEAKNLALAFKGSYNQRIIDVQKSLNKNYVVLHPIDVEKNGKYGRALVPAVWNEQYVCPKCDTLFGNKSDIDENADTHPDWHPQFCTECGQKLKWDW